MVFCFYDSRSLFSYRFCGLVKIRLRGSSFFLLVLFYYALLVSVVYPVYTLVCCFFGHFLITLFTYQKKKKKFFFLWLSDICLVFFDQKFNRSFLFIEKNKKGKTDIILYLQINIWS